MDALFVQLPVTTHSESARTALECFAEELLSHGKNCAIIYEALDADPECALVHAYVAALHLTSMTAEGQQKAGPHIGIANSLAGHASERERLTVSAISEWSEGNIARAIVQFRSLVEIWPQDLVAAKLCQVLELMYGDRAGMLRTSSMAASIDDRAGFSLGLHAFALEQNGHPELALRFARRALELAPGRDPWAQHAAAHALGALGQPVEGRAFLHAHAKDWDRCSSFMLTHNWWHLALFALELGDCSGALAMFDGHIWGVRKDHCQDQANAIALLARLEMAGWDVGDRWADVADHVVARANDRICNFLDVHYLYALARAGHDEQARHLSEFLDTHSLPDRLIGLARGLLAHAQRDYLAAATALAPVRAYLAQIGGSNVQQSLFLDMFAESVRALHGGQSQAPTMWRRAA